MPLLSVLIPVWRTCPTALLDSLWQQAGQFSQPTEILVLDDSADPACFGWHELYRHHPGIRIHTFPENLGRSRARNTLLGQAMGKWVLWLDGDLEIPDGYLNGLMRIIEDGATQPGESGPVICGGIGVEPIPNRSVTAGEPPVDMRDSLRYRYALRVEAATADRRSRAPYRWVRAAHCLMPAQAARRLSFPDFVEGYGHEDTHWALQMKAAGYVVRHIDHPVLHRGIDSNEVFLEKTRQAVSNLARLWRYDPLFARYGREISLIRAHDLLQATGLLFFITLCGPWIERRLRREGPVTLRTFAWVKLIWFDRAWRTATPFQSKKETHS